LEFGRVAISEIGLLSFTWRGPTGSTKAVAQAEHAKVTDKNSKLLRDGTIGADMGDKQEDSTVRSSNSNESKTSALPQGKNNLLPQAMCGQEALPKIGNRQGSLCF